MQSLTWYASRLATMSAQEVSWRLRTSLRNQLDRAIVPLRQRPRAIRNLTRAQAADQGLRLCDVESQHPVSVAQDTWNKALIARANRIACGRLTYFDQIDAYLGDPPDWNRDHKAQKPAPRCFAPQIDYRDYNQTGDCKFVWEPNRHHQFVVLARAYRATGDEQYTAAITHQLSSWLDQCPYGVGMNWRSPLEVAIRLINWVWAYDLTRDAASIPAVLRERWLENAHRHIWEIARNYSRGSSAGNHLIGEAAGAFIGATYFSSFNAAPRWKRDARQILEREILRQTHADGGPREQAIGYHLFITQFFALAGIVARRDGQDFSAAYWARLADMFRFIAHLQAGGDSLPMFGDCDDGYVLDLGDGPPDGHALATLGAILLDTPHTRCHADALEPAYWLLGNGHVPAATVAEPPLRSIAFPDTGYYLLQHEGAGGAVRISVGFDCGPLGLLPLGGHGHADALSFTLRVNQRDVLVDPGTYDYFTYPEWRGYFRSTRAHNTITIDDQDQSVMRGPFLWSHHAQARCLEWNPTAIGGSVVGEHDGYTRLTDPVVHRRRLDLDSLSRELLICDELHGRGKHRAAIHFHFAEDCQLVHCDGARFDFRVGPTRVICLLDPALSWESQHGSLDPIAGWVSRGYHSKAPATTLTGRTTFRNQASFVCRIRIEDAA